MNKINEYKELFSKIHSNTEINIMDYKNKSKSKVRKLTTAVASAVAVLALSSGILVTNPVLASKIPIIGKIFERVEDRVAYSGDFKDKAEVLSIEPEVTKTVNDPPKASDAIYTVEDQGVVFTASEIYCDGHSLYLTAKVESQYGGFSDMVGYASEAELEAQDKAIAVGERVDGEQDKSAQDVIKHMYAWGGGQTDQGITGENELQSIEGDVIDDNTFVGMLKIDLAQVVSGNGTFNLDLTTLGFDRYNDDSESDVIDIMHRYDGSWKLTIPYTVDTEIAKTIEIDKDITDDFKINKIFISPYQVVAYLNAPYTNVTAENFDETYSEISESLIESGEESLNFEESTEEDELKKQEIIADELEPSSNKYYHEFDLAAFNQNGEKLEWMGATLVDDHWILKYSVKGLDISELQLFFSDETLGVVKSKDVNEAKDSSIWSTEVDVK